MRAIQAMAVSRRRIGPWRAGASVALSVALAFTAASCDLVLGIEGVDEIQPSGGAGSGGTGGAGGGTGGCQPQTCDSQMWQCGMGDDGCGAPLDCGTCEAGYACNNNTHSCVCQPDSCEILQWECGAGLDHCGIELDCGPCPANQVCNAMMQCDCVPVDPCPDYQCGTFDDGCGAPVSCGDCSNVCGFPAACNTGVCNCAAPM